MYRQGEREIVDYIWVSDLENGLTFQNEYCAICHHATNLLNGSFIRNATVIHLWTGLILFTIQRLLSLLLKNQPIRHSSFV